MKKEAADERRFAAFLPVRHVSACFLVFLEKKIHKIKKMSR